MEFFEWTKNEQLFNYSCYHGNLITLNETINLVDKYTIDDGLQYACYREHFECAKKLVNYGAIFKNNKHKSWYLEKLEIEKIFVEYIGLDITSLIFENFYIIAFPLIFPRGLS